MIKKYLWVWLFGLLSMGLVACSDSDEPLKPVQPPQEEEENKKDEEEEDEEVAYQDPKAYANFFAYNVMNDVYLWKEEIASSLEKWQILADPVEAVANARYKDASGEDIDKWTVMTESYSNMTGSTDGVSTGTYGLGVKLYYKQQNSDAVVGFVTYTYPGSPAEEAGLKRGDVILQVNGVEMNASNYYNALFASASVELGVGRIVKNAYTGVEKTVSMESKAMYEDPILLSKVFDCDGKKVGYLAYTSFTFESSLGLYDVCKQFKSEGVTELILDLRYNGGGYVFTEEALASMLAPQAEVKAKSVFQTEVWNKDYMDYYKQNNVDLNTYFRTVFSQKHNDKVYDFNTSDANIGLTKIYALVSESSASASEAILVGLMPYMDIEIIGQQTHGKYCAGIMWQGEEWFQDIVDSYTANKMDFGVQHPQFADWKKHIGDWGIYVMISMYADKDGNNPCMPHGLTPEVEANDYFEEPYQLGDEREAMLNIALQRAGKSDLEARGVSSRAAGTMLPTGKLLRTSQQPLDGKLIYTVNRPNRPVCGFPTAY